MKNRYVVASKCGTNKYYYLKESSIPFSVFGRVVPEFGAKKDAIVFTNKKETIGISRKIRGSIVVRLCPCGEGAEVVFCNE